MEPSVLRTNITQSCLRKHKQNFRSSVTETKKIVILIILASLPTVHKPNEQEVLSISCLRFRASLICINNCPTRCNTKHSIYYSASSLYMFRVSTTPVIRSTQNCNYSLRYCATTSLQRGEAWPRWRVVAAQNI